MCSDENGAPHAVSFLNAQLAAFHKNATSCLEEHATARTEENKHFYALAEFSVQKPGTSETAFFTAFDEPELEFICNHEAVLHLNLRDSRLVLSSRSGQNAQPTTWDTLRLTYRLGFETGRMVGNVPEISDFPSTIPLVILGVKKATFASAKPDVTVAERDSLVVYFAKYFDLLHTAGTHVLFSLPQFDQRGSPMVIDYSLKGSTQYHVGDIHGVTVEEINTYMSSVWLQSARVVDGGTKAATDWRSRFLAEFETSYPPGGAHGNFRMRLGPPRVDILCAKEVIVYFNIRELKIDDLTLIRELKIDDLTPIEQEKRQIAMVVNALYSSESDGRVVKISIDLSHSRYRDGTLSSLPLEAADGHASDYRRRVKPFFEQYLRILKDMHYDIIYARDTRRPIPPEVEPPEIPGDEGDVKMFDFDQVIVITQSSINAQFIALSANLQSIFSHWKYQEYFTASFRPMSIRFLTNNRAIVWVHLQSGHLVTLNKLLPSREGSAKVEFGEWRLAFEVDLKTCSQDELMSTTIDSAYRRSPAYKEHGGHSDRELRLIYLDLRNADYIHEYSFRDGSGGGEKHLAQLETVLHYLTQYYFPEICNNAQHVISSVPVWKAGKSLPSYALTYFAFRVYSKVEITRYNWAHVTPGMEPIIVLLGMTGFRPPPPDHLDVSTGWIFQGNKGSPHGTISISKRVFIEGRLLSLLLHVNTLTTLIPTPSEARGFGGIGLVTWAHGQYKDQPSQWEPQPSKGDGVLKYLWEHMDSWSHKVSGHSNSMLLEHTVYCVTRNYVEIPTAITQKALRRIKVSGSVELSLTTSETMKTMLAEQDRPQHTSTSSVSWSIHITVDTTGSGVRINMPESLDPVFTDPKFSGDNIMAGFKPGDPKAMLIDVFPKKVELGAFVQEINTFEGAWQYYYPLTNAYSLANPVFNDDGDVWFQLRRYVIPDLRASSEYQSAHPRNPMNGPSSGGTLLGSNSTRSSLSPITPSNQASNTTTRDSSGDGKTTGESESFPRAGEAEK